MFTSNEFQENNVLRFDVNDIFIAILLLASDDHVCHCLTGATQWRCDWLVVVGKDVLQ